MVSWADAKNQALDQENKLLKQIPEALDDDSFGSDQDFEKIPTPKKGKSPKNAHSHQIYKNLLITIEQVEVLYNHIFDAPDPTIKISLDGVTCSTKAVSNNRNPYFMDTFSFLITLQSIESLALKRKGTIKDDQTEELINFQIIEEDKFTKDDFKGERVIKLSHFLDIEQRMGHQTLDLYELGSESKKNGNPAQYQNQKLAAKIIFGWVVKDITQAEHFSSEDGGNIYTGCDSKDYRAHDGVLLAQIHQLTGFNLYEEYGLCIDLIKNEAMPDPKKEFPERQKCKLTVGSLQGMGQKVIMDSLDILNQKIVIWVLNMKTKKIIGSFIQKLLHGCGLVDGLNSYVLFEHFLPTLEKENSKGSSNKNDPLQGKDFDIDKNPPKAIIRLSYLNSIFTRKMGLGKLTFTIKSWTKGSSESLPSNTYAMVKIFDGDGKLKQSLKNYTSIMKLLVDNTIDCSSDSHLDTIELKITRKEKALFGFKENDVEFMTVRIYLAELFGNAKIAAIVDRYYTNETVSNDHNSTIKISYSSKFHPTKYTKEEMEEWERNRKLLMGEGAKKYVDTHKSLIKNKIEVDDLEKMETKPAIVAPVDEMEKKRVSDYQGKDLFTLKMKEDMLFSDQPKGVVVMQLQALEIKWGLGKVKNLYMMVSTQREIVKTRSILSNGSENLDWGNDVIKLRTMDKNDYVYFKIYDKVDPTTVLAKAQLKLQMILVQTGSFITINPDLNFELYEDSWGDIQIEKKDKYIMETKMMYRGSEFTKNPRGKINLTVLNSNIEPFEYKIEFILNNQRARPEFKQKDLNDDIKKMKDFSANETFLNTYTTKDVLQIKIYDAKNELVGIEYREISALYLTYSEIQTSQYENNINIDFTRFKKQGQMNISVKYLPLRNNLKTDIRQKMRENIVNQKKEYPDAKKDAVKTMLIPSSVMALNSQICYMNIESIQLRNIGPSGVQTLKKIYIQLSYGKQSFISKMTFDLSKTKCLEILQNFIRFQLKDLTLKARQDKNFSVHDDHDIIVKLFSETKVLVGQTRIEAATLRQVQATDLHIDCAIDIPANIAGDKYQDEEEESTQQQSAREKEDDKDDEFQKRTTGLMQQMDQSVNQIKQKKDQKITRGELQQYLLIKISCWNAQSRVIKNPIGVLSLHNFKLINSMEEKKQKGLKIQMEVNGICLKSSLGEVADQTFDKEENYCLQTADGEILEGLFKQGMCHYMSKDFREPMEYDSAGMANNKRIVQWANPSMFNLFCSSSLDKVKIKVLQHDQLLAKTHVVLSDISMFMDGSANIALELDQGTQSQVGFSNQEQTAATCFRNLFGHFYDGKMILTFKAVFNTETVRETKSLKGLKCQQNRFIMPKQIKYNDYISKGYDELVRQHQHAKKQGKSEKKPEPPRTHKLLTLDFEAIQSMMRGQKHGFLTFEPLYDDHLEHINDEDKNKLFEKRTYQLKKNLGDIVDDLIVQPQMILRPEIQISQTFEIENFQNKIVDQQLECWVNFRVKKILISLISSDSQEEIEKHRAILAESPLMQSYNILGLTKENVLINIRQFTLDIDGALTIDKKMPDGTFPKTQSSININQYLDFSDSRCLLSSKIYTSDFIDCPCGDINLVLKRLSTNNNNIHTDQHYLKIELDSSVPKDKIIIDVSNKKDAMETSTMNYYSNKPSVEDGNSHVLINHVTNLVSRHFSDKIVIKLVHNDHDAFRMEASLSQLPIKSGESISFNAIITSSMRVKSQQPIYYNLEFDLIYHSKNSKCTALSPLDQAIENYKLMMGKESLTPQEIEILTMLMERQEIASKLTPTCLRMRRAWFFMRRLIHIQYKTLDNEKTLKLCVSPLTYLFQVFSSSSFSKSYDHYRVLDFRQRVERELENCKRLTEEDKQKLKTIELESFVNFNEGNLLQIDLQGVNLEAFGIKSPNKPMEYKKLKFMVQTCKVGQQAVTIFSKEYSSIQLLSTEMILKDQQIFANNISEGIEIKFQFMMVPQQESTSKKAELLRPLGPPQSLYLSEFTIKNNVSQPVKLTLCKKEFNLSFKIVQNALTKQPHRVIELTFHRLIRLSDDSELSGGDKGPTKLILFEQPCIQQDHEIITAEELVMDSEERGGQAAPKTEQMQKGSINEMIQEKTKEECLSNTKYQVYIDYDTCEPYKGVHKGSQKIDVNKYGKTLDRQVNKVEINNTSASNKIKLKIFRDESRQADRLREFGIGLAPTNQESVEQNKVEAGELAMGEINLSQLNSFYLNHSMGYIVPIKQTPDNEIDARSMGYTIENVYALFTISITDKTFGEIVLDLNEFRGLPECKSIREVQYRILVKPSDASVKKVDVSSRIEPIYQHLSPRIPYEIANVASLAITRELVIGVKMKDIFSNKRLFMAKGARELYAENDQRIFIDFFGIDKLNTKMLIGQKEYSLIEMIQKFYTEEENKAKEARRLKNKQKMEEEAPQAEPEEEVSGKSLGLEQEQAQKVAQAQIQKQLMMDHRQTLRKMKKAGASEEEIKKFDQEFEKRQEEERKRQVDEESQKDKNSQNGSVSGRSIRSVKSVVENITILPDGYQEYLIPNVSSTANADEATDFAVGENRPKELIEYAGIKLIQKMSWQFSFIYREEKTDAYYGRLADLQELERTRQRKKIPNILRTFEKLRGDKDLLNRTMEILQLVLASESCQTDSCEDHDLLKNVPKLLMAFRSIFIEFREVKLPITSTIALLKCCLFLKIICKNQSQKLLNTFQAYFEKAGIFTLVIEVFEDMHKQSKLVATKILNFITFMLYDVSQLYFDFLSGVRLDLLIGYINHSEESAKDTEIVACHSKLVNACCHCLFEYKGTEEDTTRIAKNDIKKLGANMYQCTQMLINGKINTSYKQDYENIAKMFCESSIRYIHLSIAKFEMLKAEKDTQLSDIFEGLFTIIVDGIASGLAIEFLDHVKGQLFYEISLILQLGIKSELNLMFDSSVILSRLQKLCEIYWENLDYNLKRSKGLTSDDDYRKDTEPYFEKIKMILEFFADQDLMNSLGENNTELIKKILSDPTVSNSSEFIIFLHNVVEADLAQEEEVAGENAKQRAQRIKKEKYGGITNINKFSISHIEWLEDQMPELL